VSQQGLDRQLSSSRVGLVSDNIVPRVACQRRREMHNSVAPVLCRYERDLLSLEHFQSVPSRDRQDGALVIVASECDQMILCRSIYAKLQVFAGGEQPRR
jgi:hypothetical protein